MYTGIWGKKIPTFIAVFVLLVSIWTTSYLIQKNIVNVGGAQQTVVPQNIKITNSTDSSFTVTFSTPSKSPASVDFGPTVSLGTISFDDRDKKSATQNPYYSHSITISDLKPETQYYFSIIINGTTFLDPTNTNKPFSTTTGPQIHLSSSQQTDIQGRVVDQNGLDAKDTLIIFSLGNSQTLSTLSNNDGSFRLPLNALRNASLNQYIVPEQTSLVTLAFQKGDLTSRVQALLKNAQTLPLVTLSNNYNFASEDLSEKNGNVAPQLVIPFPSVPPGKVTLLYPRPKTSLVDPQPMFTGTAAPGKKVSINFGPTQKISVQANVNNSGFWSFRPSVALGTGDHTITIKAPDTSGIIRTVVETFTIFPSGVQVAEAATPSASATPTPIPTSTPFPVATNTPVPTSGSSLTPTGTSTQTPTPTPTLAATPSGTTGSSTPTPTLTQSQKLTMTPSPTTSGSNTPTPTSTLLATNTTTTPSASQQSGSGTPTQSSTTITGTITPGATGDESTSLVLSGVALLFITVGSIFLFIL